MFKAKAIETEPVILANPILPCVLDDFDTDILQRYAERGGLPDWVTMGMARAVRAACSARFEFGCCGAML